MEVDAFDFDLPQELIAQVPLGERDASRLLLVNRNTEYNTSDVQHSVFVDRMVRELPSLLREGDLLIVNDARVVPARLQGKKRGSGGKVEILLIEPVAPGERFPSMSGTGQAGSEWLALGQSSKPMRQGQLIDIAGPGEHALEVVEVRGGGELRVRLPPALANDAAVFAFMEEAGSLPLPPYIERAPDAADRERYQTLFARVPGAIAAPTAGLHFTRDLVARAKERGVESASVTLHVGPGTFLPVRSARTEEHKMHRERYEVPGETAQAFARAKSRGGRVIAVGTTALRTLEAAWIPSSESDGGREGEANSGQLREGPGSTDLFCTPGYRFRAVDGLFTNFHLPKSTLLMLVAAFAGLERTLAAYQHAVQARYRFFSYGDAMLIS